MEDKENKKDKAVLYLCYITCIVACVHIAVYSIIIGNSRWLFFLPGVAVTFITGLWTLYRHERLAKWHNERHTYWHEKDGVAGEPSRWLLTKIRLQGWTFLVLGFAMCLITMM